MYAFKGIKEASDILNKSTKFLVYYDPDIDGVISGAFVTEVLNKYNFTNQYYINENRAHGFRIPLDKLEKLKGYTIIAVDFSIETQTLKTIVDMGINIINIDHHDILETELVDYSSNGYRGIVINNQYCFEDDTWRFLSGAGMVYMTFMHLLPQDFDNIRHRALVGISLLSDVRATESKEAIAFLEETYAWQDEYSQYLIDITSNGTNYSFGAQTRFDRNYIDFTFSPKLNALFRFNAGDIAVGVILGTPPNDLDLGKYKESQMAMTSYIKETLVGYEYTSLVFKAVKNVDALVSNFIGLACSQIKDERSKTTMAVVLDENGNISRGSVRGLYDNVDYLSIFKKHGIKCAGHKIAFGLQPCDISGVDFNVLNADIAVAEQAAVPAYTVERVGNLSMRLNNDKDKIAKYNSYVRSSHRVYYDCSDCKSACIKQNAKGTYVVYLIDGIQVKGFNADITPSNGGLIMPIMEKGYTSLYLQRTGS